MLGYADEHETTVLELTYNYDVTEYTKGNAYAQVSIRQLFFQKRLLDNFLNFIMEIFWCKCIDMR